MKLLKLMAKYRIASRWVLLALSFLFVFCLSLFDIPLIILFLIYIALMFIMYVFAEVYPPLIIQQKYINILFNDCNPFPLLRISEELLTYNLSPSVRRNVLINYCVALRHTGDYEKVYENLKSIDLEALHEKELSTKIVCLNNLADICMLLDKNDEALDYQNRLMELYDKMPAGTNKNALKYSAESTRADMYFLKGEYSKALAIIENIPSKTKENEISLSLFRGRIYLKIGDTVKARHNLNFVITNGNKLYAVVDAKKLLAEIDQN